MAENQELVEVLDAPTKSYSDKKEYRLIRLKQNGLRVLLISHGDADKQNEIAGNEAEEKTEKSNDKLAAVAVGVNVGGHYDNRSGVSGMAHFLEHMIFMGTEKYPEENYFDKYVRNNGGTYNAYTLYDHTIYFFNIVEDHLEGAVDCVSRFFVNPLMLKDSMNRERDSVESEFQTRVDHEFIRMEYLLATFATPGHPSSSFVCGNSKTLKEDIDDDLLYEKVHEFRRQYYESERMAVAVQSALSLDDLEELALKYFSDVPKPTEPQPLLSEQFSYEDAYTSDFYNKMCYMGSTSGNKSIVLSWCLPAVLDEYGSCPESLMGYLLDYDGPGSLNSYLKKNLLAEIVMAMLIGMSSVYSSVFINITLTEHGYQNIPTILKAVFSYLLLIKQHGTDPAIIEYLVKKKNIDFRYKEEDAPMSNVRDVVGNILCTKPKDILTASNVFSDVNVDFLQKLLDCINERKFNLTIVTSDYKGYNKKEKWVGFEYAEVDFPEEYQELWDNRTLNDEFKLPSGNPFLPSNFEILYQKSIKDTVTKYPSKIVESEIAEIWYRLDDTFLLPKINMRMGIESPHFIGTIDNFVQRNLFVSIMSELIKEILDPIKDAGYNVYLLNPGTRLEFHVDGYSDKIEEIFKILTKNFTEITENFDDKELFEVCRQKLKNKWNKTLKTANGYKSGILTIVLENNEFSSIEKVKVIDKISFEQFKHFMTLWRQQANVKFLFQGNILKETALNIAESAIETLKLQKCEGNLIKSRTLVIPERGAENKKFCYKVKTLMSESSNSVTLILYQVGQETIEVESIMFLLDEMIAESLFDTLRTQQQLGYGVHGSNKTTNRCAAYIVTVIHQEDKFTTKLVYERIEEFMEKTYFEMLKEMNDLTFENFKKAAIKSKLLPNDDLESEVEGNWSEIKFSRYQFDRKEKIAAIIGKISKEEFLAFYERHFKSPDSRVLSVQVSGNIPDAENQDQTDQLTHIDDLNEFKNSLYVYPVF